MSLSTVLSHLPKEIIIYILQFGTAMRYRNGKFIAQIQPNDPRYELLAFIKPAQMSLDHNGILLHYSYRLKYQLILYINHPRHEPDEYVVIFYKYDLTYGGWFMEKICYDLIL